MTVFISILALTFVTLFVYAMCRIGHLSDESMRSVTWTYPVGDPYDDSTWTQLTLDFDNYVCYYQSSYQGKYHDIL